MLKWPLPVASQVYKIANQRKNLRHENPEWRYSGTSPLWILLELRMMEVVVPPARNQHPAFHRPGALYCRPTNNVARLKGKNIITLYLV